MQLAVASVRAADELDPYTGVYITGAGVELIVVADGRSLTIERADGTELPVRLVADADRGSFSSGSTSIVFTRADDGSVTGLRVVFLGAVGVSAEKGPTHRGIVIIEDVVDKAVDSSPVPLPDLPLPGERPSWTSPFAFFNG
jgi:hypothetical protein